MFYQNEMQFLCDILKKSRVRTAILPLEEVLAYHQTPRRESEPFSLPKLPRDIEPYTLYKLTDAFDLGYRYLLLPKAEKPTLLLVGPYLTAPLSRERLLELGEKLGVSPSQKTHFEEYYAGLPIITAESPLFLMLTTFCERIWERPSFALVDVNNTNPIYASFISESMRGDGLDDVLINMKTMEKRYAFENELIQAVTLGQLHKEDELLHAISGQAFEKRLADPLRNAKNYGVIMNTLFRKAAENGGVHPLHLDRISSEFAARIEHMSDSSENSALMRDIFRAYCRLVRKHAMRQFSLVVQKTILLIESDLSANLSLKSLADIQNISAGYLSAIFKRDTGKTLSEYIRDKRIRYAEHLLSTTQLQVQTIALHCGVMDVQYFSKIFKKVTGKTPKEYRESSKQMQRL